MPVIVKALSREFPSPAEVRRLEFEHRILTKLAGPGVVAVMGVERDGANLALILEDLGANSLSNPRASLAIPDFLRIGSELTRALGRVHGLSVIHKDIKPQNLVVDAQGRGLKIIDFQVASEISRERQDVSLTHQLEGSLPYISPEQTGRMNRSLDYRSDYYSLGVTFFELLTGQLPFEARDVMGWVHCHISKPAPRAHEQNPSVPAMLSALVHKLMAKEPHQRYQSARGILADLERCRAALEAGQADLEFQLGQDDVSERFTLSQRIVGRDGEIAELMRTFDAASTGPGKLLLVSGYSGIGKSSIIREVQKPITAKHGYFVSGKFDQLDRSLPYAALVQALRGLIRQLLSESDQQTRRWRDEILNALGPGASVMAELIPDLCRLIGPQPAPPVLDPGAARNRFKFVFAQFLGSLCSLEHPLVIFLDDLQWADSSTPELIFDLFSNHEIRHLLIIGAYRDNEVTDGHLLRVALDQLERQAPGAVARVVLQPLGEEAVAELVANTLSTTPQRCLPLAREIRRKTEGNPYFASELLATLYREGAISFQRDSGSWAWELGAVQRFSASDNVVLLMVHRLGGLPAGALQALRMAACLGNVFSLSTLASLLDKSPDAAARMLWEPLQEALIVPLDEGYRLMCLDTEPSSPAALDISYRFQHDRVQQAAYSLIADADRAAMHLRIGRQLLAREKNPKEPHDPFAAANHLNLGCALIESVEERAALTQLNRRAGANAFAATAFDVAAKYQNAAIACLNEREWAERPELRYSTHADRIPALLMAGERERAALLCDELLSYAMTNAERGAVFMAKCQVMSYQAKMVEALGAVRQGLALFGIDFPEDHAAIDQGIGIGIGKMQSHLARVSIEGLVDLPELKDAEKTVAMRLLAMSVPPAIMVYPPLFILAELLMFDLALSFGTTAVSAKNFVDCGMIVGAVLGDYRAAYRLGKVAFRVLDRYGARALGCQVNFVFAGYVSPWGAPYDEAMASFVEANRLGIETGDHQHLAVSEAQYLRMKLNLGRHLDECDAAATSTAILFEKIRSDIARDAIRLCRRAIDRLRDPAENPAAVEGADRQLTDEIVESGNAQWCFQHGQIQMLVNVVLGDWDAAVRWSEFTGARAIAASSLFTVPEYQLCEVLITTQKRWPEATAEARAALLQSLDANLAKLRGASELCPENFAHKYHLAAAEIGRIKEEPLEQVLGHFEQAVETTGSQFLHLRALATELSGRYWLERGHRRFAESLLTDALRLYAEWGAKTKVVRLERQLATSFGRARPSRDKLRATPGATLVSKTTLGTGLEGSLQGNALDLGSVLKATQAISSEVKSEGLYSALMGAILENAAAERGALILPDDTGQLVVRARAEASSGAREVTVQHALDQDTRLCPQIVRYTARSLEPLVIDDAGAHPTFGADSYVQKAGIRSVLCMPIVNQGGLVAVLYVENNATTHAFTAARVETLRLIAGQAAISITNASLYESLELKVAERTRELAAKNRKIDAMLNGMQQGVFTVDESLAVQPEYSRHLENIFGRGDLGGLPLGQLLFDGAEVGAEVRATTESALRFSFGGSPTIALANASHLVKDYSRTDPDGNHQHLEVDWNWICGDTRRVEKVLVTVRDVTLIRGLQHAADLEARETELMTQILDAGVEDFRNFSDAAKRTLGEQIAELTSAVTPDRERARALFRNVHTLKGHARTLGLSGIVTAAHLAEDACTTRDGEQAGGHVCLMAVQQVLALVLDYERVGRKKLGRLWVGADERFKRAIGAIESALAQSSERPSYPVRALSQVRQAMNHMQAVSLDQVLRETARAFPSLAEELGKSVPAIEWQDDGTLLDAEWGQLVRDALVHSFRNSLDHGIETPSEREAAGKCPRGKIALWTERSELGVNIHLADDGRGLPVEELRSKTGQANSPDTAVAEAIFEFGVSTAKGVSQISGRGIGMDAVRGFFREHGGDVGIQFTGAAQSGYRPFELVFRLPSGAALKS